MKDWLSNYGRRTASPLPNACWALGYMKAEQALERLESIEQDDPNEEVRNAAVFAISEIKDT